MPSLRGLYAITDAALLPDHYLVEGVEQALAGGARLIQYRDKSLDQQRRQQQAFALQKLCARYGVALIINDDVERALDEVKAILTAERLRRQRRIGLHEFVEGLRGV